ncbi:unknown [Paraprevotella clara CAG:116]|nr:unknown [Paraprevotella clara CAG:116]
MVSAVQTDFIIYFLFIPGQLFFRISAVPAIFRNTEMFDIHRLVSLGNRKIRSIGFVRIPHIIRINLLVHIVDAVHEQEIRYPDLLNRP